MSHKNKILDDIVKEFHEIKIRLITMKEKYQNEDFGKQPSEKAWSAGDCIEHLTKANREYIINTKKVMANSGESDENNSNYKPRFIAGKFIDMMQPQSKLKLKAPQIFKKFYNGDLEDTITRYTETLDEFIELAEKSKKYDLRIKVASPVTSLVKFQLGEMYMLMIVHQKRHLTQAEKALKAISN